MKRQKLAALRIQQGHAAALKVHSCLMPGFSIVFTYDCVSIAADRRSDSNEGLAFDGPAD